MARSVAHRIVAKHASMFNGSLGAAMAPAARTTTSANGGTTNKERLLNGKAPTMRPSPLNGADMMDGNKEPPFLNNICPSVGTIGHPYSCARWGCKYNTKAKGCNDGKLCLGCHICPWKPNGPSVLLSVSDSNLSCVERSSVQEWQERLMQSFWKNWEIALYRICR